MNETNFNGQNRLYVEYSGGFDGNKDARIVEAIGRESAGSGFSFENGVRDLEFMFVRRDAALRAASRARKIRGVRARVESK